LARLREGGPRDDDPSTPRATSSTTRSGDHLAGVEGYSHSLKHYFVVCCPCSESAAKSPALLQSSLEIAGLALPKSAGSSCSACSYQAEIRHC